MSVSLCFFDEKFLKFIHRCNICLLKELKHTDLIEAVSYFMCYFRTKRLSFCNTI